MKRMLTGLMQADREYDRIYAMDGNKLCIKLEVYTIGQPVAFDCRVGELVEVAKDNSWFVLRDGRQFYLYKLKSNSIYFVKKTRKEVTSVYS